MNNRLLPQHIAHYGALLALLGLWIVFVWISWPFANSIIWAAVIVLSSWQVFIYLEKKFSPYRWIAIALMLLIWILFAVVLIAGLFSTVLSHTEQLVELAKQQGAIALPKGVFLQQIPWIGERLYALWHQLSTSGGQLIENKLSPYLGNIVNWLVERGQNLGVLLFDGVITLIISYFFYSEGRTLHRFIQLVLAKLFSSHGDNLLILTEKTIKAVLFGVILTSIIQAVLSAVVLWALKIPFLSLLALLIFVFCLLQIGPLPILIPVIIWLYFQSSWGYFTLLVGWSLLVSVGDNLLRPYLFTQQLKLPSWLVFFSMLGGTLAMGVVGIFTGPIIFAIAYYLLLEWVNKPLTIE